MIVSLLGCSAFSQQQSNQQSNVKETPSLKVAPTQVYECGDYEFGISGNTDQIKLYLSDRTITLDQVPAASGAKYQNSDAVFWHKGDRARLEIEAKNYNCQSNPQREPRIEQGKRPVDFRATGNEPGWLLEIVDAHHIRILTDYGNNQVVTPAPAPQTNEAKIYEVETPAHKLRIVIQPEACTDTMSGEKFESQVTVLLDGETFVGCGQSLINSSKPFKTPSN
ncbi:MAG: MliC family protein [Pleurocapsa sp.]